MTTWMKIAALSMALMPVAGQSVWACGASSEELVLTLPGEWEVSNGFGTLTIGQRTIPLPAGNVDVAQIVPTADGMAVTGGGALGTYALTFVEDARFVLDAPSQAILDEGEAWFDDKPNIFTEDELAVLAGCADGQLPPQLRATGQYQDPEGTVEFSLYLFVVSETLMYGVVSGELKTMNGTAKRVTRWLR